MAGNAESKDIARGSLPRLIAHIDKQHGVDLAQYRTAYVERRVATRLRALDLRTYRQYTDVLDADPEEYHRLIDALTINVTDFFRDKIVWDVGFMVTAFLSPTVGAAHCCSRHDASTPRSYRLPVSRRKETTSPRFRGMARRDNSRT